MYLTGRTVGPDDAAAVTAAGGEGVAVRVDHADDTSVAALFERVGSEDTQLDLLVNNAAVISDVLTDRAPFWEKPWPSAT